jgi:hypothetical protein
MPTTSENNIHPASSLPSMMTTAQSARIQALTQEVSVSVSIPDPDPEKRKEKKMRHKKRLAGEPSQAEPEQDPRQSARPGKKRLRKMKYQQRQSTPFECMLLTAENAQFTGSVLFGNSSKSSTNSNDEPQALPDAQALSESSSSSPRINHSRTLHVQTSCTLTLTESATTSAVAGPDTTNTMLRLQVQPLLVLDLNGILCHRIRSRPSIATNAVFRPCITRIAGTPVVPRTDLHGMLHYLDQHFCLAVWTSAKAKTARQLVASLIPPAVAAKLLFVWAQHDCETVVSVSNTNRSCCDDNDIDEHENDDNDDDNSSKFKKNLSKVWKEYPVWNASNTLLMDDSPDKCVAWRENAVHPPPLNGLDIGTRDDEINARQQRLFLEELVQHWNEHSVVQIWDETSGDATVPDNTQGQLQFLKQHAVGHMGWSASS